MAVSLHYQEQASQQGWHSWPQQSYVTAKPKKKTIICHPKLQGNKENRLARIQPINQGNKLHKKKHTHTKIRPKQASKIYIEETDQNNCNLQGVYSLKVLVFETSSSVKQEFNFVPALIEFAARKRWKPWNQSLKDYWMSGALPWHVP